ncbi:MAG: hypothetical protein KZQ93_18605 [Candidatus Thiodiazotropha sp. (ex Monitilora ramsayi)]|nr:hypothetical protein [Candidatus Thiodiazotropha sp. (ex Monitilora ramsayi)]
MSHQTNGFKITSGVPAVQHGRRYSYLLPLFILALLTALLSPFTIQLVNETVESVESRSVFGILFAFSISLLIVSMTLYLTRRLNNKKREEEENQLLQHLQHPRNCFCKLAFEDLEVWFKRRYVDKVPTIKLLEEATNDKEREAISAIAMLDLDEETMLSLMGDVNMPHHHIIHCRAQFFDLLKKSIKLS